METDAGNYEDSAINRYANQVMEIIQEECAAVPQERKLKAVIATIAVSDAAQIIKDFQEGDGDILIVKMMASAGLDIDRLKVALDLSTVRTDGSFVQRVMRIATRWERDGRAAILKALYISPDDCLGQELYQRLIHDQGGGGSAVEWEDSEEIETSGNGPPQFNLTEYEPIETRLDNVLQDEDGSEGPGSLLPVVDNLMSDLSHTTREIGKGRMSSRLYEAVVEAAGVMIAVPPNGPTASPEPSPATADGDLVDNTQQRRDLKRKQLVRMVKRHIATTVTQDRTRMGQAIQRMWRELYELAGLKWPAGMEPGQMLKSLDEPALDKLIGKMKGVIDGRND